MNTPMVSSEERPMVYAPILIPTLCRDAHFIRCVESLKVNSWAKYTDVYIALDYPAKEAHCAGYERICAYLEGDFSAFRSFTVVKRAENYGVSRNMRELRVEVLQHYDRYIRTDDDIEFSPNFLEYMDKALMYYENDEQVVAVSGFSSPAGWKTTPGATALRQGFTAPMWGTGFWKHKYTQMAEYITSGGLLKDFETTPKRALFKNMIDASVCEYIAGYVSRTPEKSVICRVTDLTVRMYLSVRDKYVVVPTLSKSRNWGHDGSGISCPQIENKKKTKGLYTDVYNYSEQEIDQNDSFTLVDSEELFEKENFRSLNRFERVDRKKMLFYYLRWGLLKCLGRKRYNALIDRKKG